MGYRSQVVLGIAPEAAHAFMAMLASNPDALDLCNQADDYLSGYEQEGDYLVHWSHIKWYTNYEDVGPIQAFVEALDADDLSEYGEGEAPDLKGRPATWHDYFRFIRIGEDNDDIEELGHGFWDVGVVRQINF